jgi:hypothetical protein
VSSQGVEDVAREHQSCATSLNCLAQCRSQRAFVRTALGAAARELPVNHDRRDAKNTVLCGSGSDLALVHVVDLDLVLSVCQFLHEFNGAFARRATGAEDFNRVLHIPLLSMSSFVFCGRQAGQDGDATTRRGHAFQTAAMSSKPIPVYMVTMESS